MVDRPIATFIVHGRTAVTVEVLGRFDGAAAVGFDAVVAGLIGDRHVTIDLSRCDAIDDVALQAVAAAARRIEARGGRASVQHR